METVKPQLWESPHAAWFMTGSGSFIDGNLLTSLVKKGYHNSFQVTVKLWKTPQYYSDEELATLGQIVFGSQRNTNDFIFCKQLSPEHSSTRLEPTPIIVTNRDMDNSIVGYLSLRDLVDLMQYTDSVQSCNAARILFAFLMGIEDKYFGEYWYDNPITKLRSRDSQQMIQEEEKHALASGLSEPEVEIERDW